MHVMILLNPVRGGAKWVGQNEKNMIIIYYILHIEREYGGQ